MECLIEWAILLFGVFCGGGRRIELLACGMERYCALVCLHFIWCVIFPPIDILKVRDICELVSLKEK